ncbi:hypothetical protein ACFLQL_00105 [Verrucomicrobiota bacterium]
MRKNKLLLVGALTLAIGVFSAFVCAEVTTETGQHALIRFGKSMVDKTDEIALKSTVDAQAARSNVVVTLTLTYATNTIVYLDASTNVVTNITVYVSDATGAGILE